MNKVAIIVSALLLAAAGWSAAHLAPAAGLFNDVEERLVGDCRRVDIAPGTEDVEIDEASGQVFVSTFERRGWYAGEDARRPRGDIYMIDLNDRTLTPTLVSRDAPADFSPHGISLWREPDGQRRLFVVNHRSDGGEFVELFDIGDDGVLYHTESVAFDAMHSPNDVVAVGNRQFYATNDLRYDSGLLSFAEVYGALPLTDLVYFDGVDGRRIAAGFAYANGVARSDDGSEIYVSEVVKRRVSVFRRDEQTGALRLKKRWPVNTAPDNIDVAPDGALWVAGHLNTTKFLRHAADPAKSAPSHVLRLDPRSGETEDVFVALEGQINASSVGAASDDTLIVGAVFDGHVMICPLD